MLRKKRFLASVLALALAMYALAGCGGKDKGSASSGAASSAASASQSGSDASGSESELVHLIIPVDFLDPNITQEQCDERAAEEGLESITLNDDGTLTYVMSKEKHEEMLSAVGRGFLYSISELPGSDACPNVTDIQVSPDFLSYTVTTISPEVTEEEKQICMSFFMYSDSYYIYAGDTYENVTVEFINADTQQVIYSTDMVSQFSAESGS